MVLIKNLLTNILFLVAFSAFGQLNQESDTISVSTLPLLNDSTEISTDTALKDSVARPVLESIITYTAEDSTIADFENQKVYMYKGGVVNTKILSLRPII